MFADRKSVRRFFNYTFSEFREEGKKINRYVNRQIIITTMSFTKRMYRATFELVWQDPRSKKKMDGFSYGRKRCRSKFFRREDVTIMAKMKKGRGKQ
jgi:hypothetical protein